MDSLSGNFDIIIAALGISIQGKTGGNVQAMQGSSPSWKPSRLPSGCRWLKADDNTGGGKLPADPVGPVASIDAFGRKRTCLRAAMAWTGSTTSTPWRSPAVAGTILADPQRGGGHLRGRGVDRNIRRRRPLPDRRDLGGPRPIDFPRRRRGGRGGRRTVGRPAWGWAIASGTNPLTGNAVPGQRQQRRLDGDERFQIDRPAFRRMMDMHSIAVCSWSGCGRRQKRCVGFPHKFPPR